MYISLSWTGNSSSMVISVGLHDENPRNNPNTDPKDGNVKLLMQKDRDTATAQELFDAEVKNGRWQSPPWDMSDWKKQGFDTLVAQYPGIQPVYRRLGSPQASQTPASQTGNARQTQKKTVIDFTGVELTKKSDGKKFDVEVSGKILADGQPLCQTQLDFFWKGRIEPACQLSPGLKTDDNGRFSFTYTDKPAEGARIKMEVQVRGGTSRQYELDMPAPPQEAKKAAAPKPTALVALLVSSMLGADKVSHRIALVCKDQNEKPIDCGFVYWTAGKDGGELDLSKGAATHTVEIAVPEANIPYTVWAPNFALSLPTPLTLTGPAKKKKLETGSLQFKLPEGVLKSENNCYKLPVIRTLTGEGKFGPAELIFRATTPVTLINLSTGYSLAHKGQTAKDTKYFEYETPTNGLALLECSFSGLECSLTILHVDSGEEASLAMEFQY